jgi:general secretion pathway protein H
MVSPAAKTRMPTSVTGNSALPHRRGLRCGAQRGFTLIELLIVLAIIAVGAALVAVALPDPDASRLEEEGARLSALLEMARAEARVSGVAVSWTPRTPADGLTDLQGAPVHFRFVGLPASVALPSRWLDGRVGAQVVGASALILGPAAILPPQRVVLTLAQQRLELVSDGLGPFAVALVPAADAAPR